MPPTTTGPRPGLLRRFLDGLARWIEDVEDTLRDIAGLNQRK